MIYLIALTVIACVLGLHYLFKDLYFFKKNGIPHVKPLPIVGNMGSVFLRYQTLADVIKTIYSLEPNAKYAGMYDMNKPIIMLREPELIKSITLKHFDTFPDHRAFIEEYQDILFGKNLFNLRGDRWREIRSVLSPAFTSSKMKGMFKLMSDCGVDFVNYLVQLPAKQRIMETKDIFTRYTNDVIATCAFGVSVDSMRNPNNEFYVYGKEATVFSITALLKMYMFRSLPWLAQLIGLKIIRDEITNFFRDLVKTTIRVRDEKNIVRPDMMQLMMESRNRLDGKKEMTIDDMTGQAFSFFFGGFDSTSSLMCFAAHEIAVNQEVQEKIQKEIDRVLEETNGQAPYETVMHNMEYLDAVINETLRFYPIAVAMDRLCIKDFELPPSLPGMEPLAIKKGQGLWIPVYGLHHDPKYFEEPEKFDPERFIGERKKASLNCGAYLPFGQGPRMCIGNRFALMETKILLFHMLARCDLKPCEKTQIPLRIAKDGFNMKAEKGFWLEMVPRKYPHHTIAVK